MLGFKPIKFRRSSYHPYFLYFYPAYHPPRPITQAHTSHNKLYLYALAALCFYLIHNNVDYYTCRSTRTGSCQACPYCPKGGLGVTPVYLPVLLSLSIWSITISSVLPFVLSYSIYYIPCRMLTPGGLWSYAHKKIVCGLMAIYTELSTFFLHHRQA